MDFGISDLLTLFQQINLTPVDMILRLVVGFVLGFIIALSGVGGGVLLIPTLKILFKMDTASAIGTASLYITITKIVAGFEHARIKNINYYVSGQFLIGAIPGTLLTAIPINYYSEIYRGSEKGIWLEEALNMLVVVTILVSVVVIAWDTFFRKKKDQISENPRVIKSGLLGGISGFGCGMIMGATGIGGGVLIVPVLISVMRLGAKKTIGSSILIALVLSFITALIYSSSGNSDNYTALLLALGSVLGVLLAGRAIKKISGSVLQLIVLGLVILSSVLLLF